MPDGWRTLSGSKGQAPEAGLQGECRHWVVCIQWQAGVDSHIQAKRGGALIEWRLFYIERK